jgi:molybdate transport system ATP-binding protein
VNSGLSIQVRKRLRSAEGPLEVAVDLSVGAGEHVALFGASGSGKTSILRMLAGLMKPDEGTIVVDGQTWFDSARGIDLPPHRRRPGLVFQDHALFPHRTARQNILDGLPTGPSRAEKAHAFLERFELGGVADMFPRQLSGGQKQRVALARTLASEPRLLLLDEPLSALDAGLRGRMLEEIGRHVSSFAGPLVLVSHDMSEVWRLAKVVHLLESGTIRRSGTPSEVFGKGRTSPRLRLPATVLELEESEGLVVVTAAAGGEIVRAVVSREEASQLSPGCAVLLAAKAYETMVLPLDPN